MTITTAIDELKARHRATWAAGDYAAVADALVSELGERAVAHARPQPGASVLDVATGAGNAAIPAALWGADVTALDLVPSLLEQARTRAGAAGVEIDWVEGDAEALPFADDRFDVVLSVLGVQFAPRHEVAARELARVVRSGGTVVLCNWTPGGFIGRLFKTMSPHLPAPPAGASPPPRWGDPDHVRGLFAGTGVEPAFELGTVTFGAESPEAFVAFMADHYGPLVKARELLGPAGAWAALEEELVGLGRDFDHGVGGFRVASEYLLVRGRKA